MFSGMLEERFGGGEAKNFKTKSVFCKTGLVLTIP